MRTSRVQVHLLCHVDLRATAGVFSLTPRPAVRQNEGDVAECNARERAQSPACNLHADYSALKCMSASSREKCAPTRPVAWHGSCSPLGRERDAYDKESAFMMDVFFLLVIVGFFAIAVAYARACDRL